MKNRQKLRDKPAQKVRAGKRIALRHAQLPVVTPPPARAKVALPATPEVIPIPRVGRLRTVADWHKQVAKVYRAMRKGYLPKEDGTRLTYVANIGAQLAKYKDEMREIEKIREQLEALKAGGPQALLTGQATDDDGALEPAP